MATSHYLSPWQHLKATILQVPSNFLPWDTFSSITTTVFVQKKKISVRSREFRPIPPISSDATEKDPINAANTWNVVSQALDVPPNVRLCNRKWARY